MEGGELLAAKLTAYRQRPDIVVLGLARGGVPVAITIARALEAPVDVLVVRKLGVPWHEELAMGAIAPGGVRVLNEDVIHALHIPSADVDREAEIELRELERRERLYRGARSALELSGRTAILVDDGLATGTSMRAAVASARLRAVARVVCGAPVAPPQTCDAATLGADEVVCVLTPTYFGGVGAWYQVFDQLSDDEVCQMLQEAWRMQAQV
jgi:predicted phosphoribosyltransferase